jgi:hypothetical protein
VEVRVDGRRAAVFHSDGSGRVDNLSFRIQSRQAPREVYVEGQVYQGSHIQYDFSVLPLGPQPEGRGVQELRRHAAFW